MDASEGTKMLKRMDPIWKRVRVERFWAVLFVVYTVLFLGYALWARYFSSSKDASLVWIYLFNILLWGSYVMVRTGLPLLDLDAQEEKKSML